VEGLNLLEEEKLFGSGKSSRDAYSWIPSHFPPHFKAVFTYSIIEEEGPMNIDEYTSRGWESVTVSPLSREDLSSLIRRYLRMYGKSLPASLEAELLRTCDDQSVRSSPLFVVTLLEEAIACSRYDVCPFFCFERETTEILMRERERVRESKKQRYHAV
jgi:hypothetical protein